MSTSERSFNQVKAILRKLDRSISEARERRTQAPPPAPTGARPPGASGYGRATPIPPGRTSGGQGVQRWST